MTFTGQNVGGGKNERVMEGLSAVTKICGGIALFLLAFFWIGGSHMMGIFVSDTDITSIAVTGREGWVQGFLNDVRNANRNL